MLGVRSYFFDTRTVTSDFYLMFTQYTINELSLQIRLAGYFQQDGAPPYRVLTVRTYLDQNFQVDELVVMDHCADLHNP